MGIPKETSKVITEEALKKAINVAHSEGAKTVANAVRKRLGPIGHKLIKSGIKSIRPLGSAIYHLCKDLKKI